MFSNKRKKILIAYGTRPEAIKLAPLIRELRKEELFEVQVVCSGQHNELLRGILEIWELSPDITLQLEPPAALDSITASMMRAMSKVLREVNPDLVVVQGDTSTAFTTAIESHSLKIPVAHVEAGLRSQDIWNPWPEESYRRSIDAVSSFHFAPTNSALVNLRNEGYIKSSVEVGNTVVDALNFVVEQLKNDKRVQDSLKAKIPFSLDLPYIVFTQHRREGFGSGQDKVFEAVRKISENGTRVIFPVHLNPNVRSKSKEYFSACKNVHLMEPLEYLEFIELLRNCHLVISDSGGLQEEVPSFGKCIVITRLTTERPEVIESGHGILVGYDTKKIENAVAQFSNSRAGSLFSKNPFGDGRASERICRYLKEIL